MIKQAELGIYCDYCQDAWGGARVDGVWVWNLKAKTQAQITIISTKKSTVARSYCSVHLQEIQNWPTGAHFYDIENQVKGQLL